MTETRTPRIGIVPFRCSTCGLRISVDADAQEPWPTPKVREHLATHRKEKA